MRHVDRHPSMLWGLITADDPGRCGVDEKGVEESEPSVCQPLRAASLIVAQLGPLIVVGENRLIIVAQFGHPLAAPLA